MRALSILLLLLSLVSYSEASFASKLSSVDEIILFLTGKHTVSEGLVSGLKWNHFGLATTPGKIQELIERSSGAMGSEAYLLRLGTNASGKVSDFLAITDLDLGVLSFTFYSTEQRFVTQWIESVNKLLQFKHIPIRVRQSGVVQGINFSGKTYKGSLIDVENAELVSADELKRFLNLITDTPSELTTKIQKF